MYVFDFYRAATTVRMFVSYLDKDRNKIKGVFNTVLESVTNGLRNTISNFDVDDKDSGLPEIR